MCITVLGLLGCAGDKAATTEPDTTPPQLTIVSPEPDAIVADTVEVTIECSDNIGIGRVTILIDNSPIGFLYRAPWSLRWPVPLSFTGSTIALAAEAVDLAGNIRYTNPQSLHLIENHPPRIRIKWPPDQIRLDLDRHGRLWECEASDLDDGAEFSEPIYWFLNGEVMANHLPLIPPPTLATGMYQIDVQVSDRWGRVAKAGHTVYTFHYPEPSTPAAACRRLLLALQARNTNEATAALAEDFRYIPPGRTPVTGMLFLHEFNTSLRLFFTDSLLSVFTIDATIPGAREFEWRHAEWAMIELYNLVIGYRRQESIRAGIQIAVETPTTTSTVARLFWRRSENGTDQWELCSWWDLHDAYPGGTTGPAWAEILSIP